MRSEDEGTLCESVCVRPVCHASETHRDRRYVMAGWWQTPAVSLPVRIQRPAWRTSAHRAFPAELMESLSLIPQLITSARSSLMKESPHRDETRPEKRRRRRDLWESKSVREWKNALWEQKNRLRRDRRRSDTWRTQTKRENLRGRASKWERGKNKTLCERKRGEMPGNEASLKMCVRSSWPLLLVNRVPAVLLFKVKYIHKLIKLVINAEFSPARHLNSSKEHRQKAGAPSNQIHFCHDVFSVFGACLLFWSYSVPVSCVF